MGTLAQLGASDQGSGRRITLASQVGAGATFTLELPDNGLTDEHEHDHEAD